MRKDYGRVITAMATPFTADGEVDYARAAELARRLVDSGSDGLVVAGTTGESPALTKEEKLRLFETVAAAVGDRAFVWAGTGSNDTAASVELSRLAIERGADGVMLVVPYYNKPPQEGLIRHFTAIADAIDRPVLLYNVPGRTAANLAPETVARLADHPRIIGIKEANPSLDQASEIRRLCPEEFRIYSGEDSITLPMLAVGAVGVVSVASHLVAGELAQMIDAFERGAVDRAREIHLRLMPLFKALFLMSNPIPLKCALELAGFPVGPTRPPLSEADERVRNRLAEVLAELGLLERERVPEVGV